MGKFITIIFIQVLYGMEMDLFIPSFPELQEIFSLTPVMVQLTISVNFIAFCACSLFAGTLGDRFNRRTILLMGMLIFVLGSVLCVMAPSYTLLIVGRLLQGIGISAPAILSFPILLENCPPQKQPERMAIVNGVKTMAMAIAPVIGSFINLYFHWRGNFSLLLGLGGVCLLASYFSIPHKIGNPLVSFSLKSYLPLLKSNKFRVLQLCLMFLVAALWSFMGMAPIFYIEGMGVPLKSFGYYQGVITFAFAIMCILSPQILKRFGQKCCLYFGIGGCIISAILMLGLIVFQIHQPKIITAVIALFSLGCVFPINILYPLSLEVLPNSAGKAAGLGQAIVFLATALLLELIGYFYNETFTPIGVAMLIAISLSFILFYRIIKNKWLSFYEEGAIKDR